MKSPLFVFGKWYVTPHEWYSRGQRVPKDSLLFCVGKGERYKFLFLYQEFVVELVVISRNGWRELQDDGT